MKRCSKCGEVKPLTEFYPAANHKDGRASSCKACRHNWYVANREREIERVREYSIAHPETHQNWCEANYESWTSYMKQWRADNKEKRRESKRKWEADNPEKVKQHRRNYKAKHGRQVRANKLRRRAQKAGNGGSYTAAEWIELCATYNDRCLCCGSEAKLTVDHVVPVIVGGSNSIDNLQPLCLPCNIRKGTKTIDYRLRYAIQHWYSHF